MKFLRFFLKFSTRAMHCDIVVYSVGCMSSKEMSDVRKKPSLVYQKASKQKQRMSLKLIIFSYPQVLSYVDRTLKKLHTSKGDYLIKQ